MADKESSPIGKWLAADAQRRRDRDDGIPRVGGTIGPDYLKAYFTAARLLVDATAGNRPEMAVPCAYLQRHALELACKSIIEWALLIRAESESIEAIERTGNWSDVSVQASPTGHDLAVLAETMSGALAHIGFESPVAMLSLIEDMARFEDDDPTRLRYASGKPKGRYAARSFPEPVIVPVVEWQQRLDQLECEVLVLSDDWNAATRTFCDRLYMEHHVNQERLNELNP